MLIFFIDESLGSLAGPRISPDTVKTTMDKDGCKTTMDKDGCIPRSNCCLSTRLSQEFWPVKKPFL